MQIRPIGRVSSPRTEVIDDDWDSIQSTITLDDAQFSAEALLGITDFSHLEIVYVFDKRDPATIQSGARRPRNNPEWPLVGIFAQRGSARPNLIGVSTCTLLGADELTLTVRGLDAIDGTPVLDVKPYLAEFAPRGQIRQPQWSHELMANYW